MGQLVHTLAQWREVCVYNQLRVFRFFVWSCQACHIGDFTFTGFFVKAFRVSFFALVHGAFHVALIERIVFHQFSYKHSAFFVRGDEGGKHQDPGIHHNFGHLGNSADVFLSVYRAQTQIIVQTTADIVPIQNITSDAHVEQTLFKGMGQGGFPAAGKASKPYQRASVAVEAVAVGLLDGALKWEDIGFHGGRDFLIVVIFWHGFHGFHGFCLGTGKGLFMDEKGSFVLSGRFQVVDELGAVCRVKVFYVTEGGQAFLIVVFGLGCFSGFFTEGNEGNKDRDGFHELQVFFKYMMIEA